MAKNNLLWRKPRRIWKKVIGYGKNYPDMKKKRRLWKKSSAMGKLSIVSRFVLP